ncbi:MAG: hypothetical protein ABIO37_15730, partial [Caulobacteraceae bacterium]
VRRDWQDLRDRAADDPETLVLGYRDLAEELANETEAAQAARPNRLARGRVAGLGDDSDPSWR